MPPISPHLSVWVERRICPSEGKVIKTFPPSLIILTPCGVIFLIFVFFAILGNSPPTAPGQEDKKNAPRPKPRCAPCSTLARVGVAFANARGQRDRGHFPHTCPQCGSRRWPRCTGGPAVLLGVLSRYRGRPSPALPAYYPASAFHWQRRTAKPAGIIGLASSPCHSCAATQERVRRLY